MSAPNEPIDCAALRDQVDTLAVSLAEWAYRDDSKAQPEVRQAANVQSDDAAMRRSGELLARIRAERKLAEQLALRERLVAAPLPPCCWVTDHVPHPGNCCRHGDTANCPSDPLGNPVVAAVFPEAGDSR